ncbi:hypothetical protein YC2023_005216 [Brassica napus]
MKGTTATNIWSIHFMASRFLIAQLANGLPIFGEVTGSILSNYFHYIFKDYDIYNVCFYRQKVSESIKEIRRQVLLGSSSDPFVVVVVSLCWIWFGLSSSREKSSHLPASLSFFEISSFFVFLFNPK